MGGKHKNTVNRLRMVYVEMCSIEEVYWYETGFVDPFGIFVNRKSFVFFFLVFFKQALWKETRGGS